MLKVRALALLATVLPGCVVPAAIGKREVEWPDEHSAKLVVPPMEAGAALAAAAAIREMIKTNPHPRLFRGCSSPEQGLEVEVFTGPTPGLYYVVLEERFDRCGGPRGRVLDWWYVYAVTPQGEVVAEAPQPQPTWEDTGNAPPSPSPTPPPAAAPTKAKGDTPAPTPPPAPSPPPMPEAPSPPPAAPSPASPPPIPPAPGTPDPTSASPEGL
jgi:hypothetical protein